MISSAKAAGLGTGGFELKDVQRRNKTKSENNSPAMRTNCNSFKQKTKEDFKIYIPANRQAICLQINLSSVECEW
jgi:hypothetical protein